MVGMVVKVILGGGKSKILYVHPFLGKSSNLTHIFADGLVQPPTSIVRVYIYISIIRLPVIKVGMTM